MRNYQKVTQHSFYCKLLIDQQINTLIERNPAWSIKQMISGYAHSDNEGLFEVIVLWELSDQADCDYWEPLTKEELIGKP